MVALVVGMVPALSPRWPEPVRWLGSFICFVYVSVSRVPGGGSEHILWSGSQGRVWLVVF